jgi:hypothetical protein
MLLYIILVVIILLFILDLKFFKIINKEKKVEPIVFETKNVVRLLPPIDPYVDSYRMRNRE